MIHLKPHNLILSHLNESKSTTNLKDYEFKVFSQWGEDGIIQLIRDAIMDVQPLIGDASNPAVKVTSARKVIPNKKGMNKKLDELEEKFKKAKTDEAKNKIADEIETLKASRDDTGELIQGTQDFSNITFNIDKATLLARSIVKLTKYNGRHGGFDIEKLLNARDPEKLRAYIDDIFDHLDQSTIDDLFNGLKNNIKLLTSGRLKERIRLKIPLYALKYKNKSRT